MPHISLLLNLETLIVLKSRTLAVSAPGGLGYQDTGLTVLWLVGDHVRSYQEVILST